MEPSAETRVHPYDTERASIIEACNISRRFGATVALDDVSLVVAAGEIHALLGPNGAGKTTFLRVLTGLVHPQEGSVRILGFDAVRSPRALRQRIGLVPSGDRSFYLRISGLENLAFFARLHGLGRRSAISRARLVLHQVGLTEAARIRVGLYSHGMQKRLAVARALLASPSVLLLDEPTHDLDPRGAREIRDLVRTLVSEGAAVIWATQRIEEVRGFADTVTLLSRGRVRFSGGVPELLAHAAPRRYLLHVRNGLGGGGLERALNEALEEIGKISGARGSPEHYLLALQEGAVLGEAISRLTRSEFQVLTCTEARSGLEEAFLELTKDDGA